MNDIAGNIQEIAGSQVTEICLHLNDFSIGNTNVEKLMDFLQSKIQGKYILNSKINGVQLVQTCRDELLRKTDTNIKSLDTEVKKSLQKLIGEYLFETLQPDKQKEIVEAILNKETILIKIDVSGIEEEDILFFPWEYLRCSTELVGQFQKMNPIYQNMNPLPIWLLEKTMFYRITGANDEVNKRNSTINALLVDATSEQSIYKFFAPVDADGEDRMKKFREGIANINFEVLGQRMGDNRAALANLVDYVELKHPEIIHLIVDSFSMKDNKSYLGFFQPDSGNDVKVDIEFSQNSLGEVDSNWLAMDEKRATVFIIQERASANQTQFEALEKIALLLSNNNIPSTLVIPHQKLSEKDHFESFYAALSGGDSVGNAAKKLRVSFLNKGCYSLPILYLSNKDFVLVEKGGSSGGDKPKPTKTKGVGTPFSDSIDEARKKIIKTLLKKQFETLDEIEKETGNTLVSLKGKLKENTEKIRSYGIDVNELGQPDLKDIDLE